MDSTNGKEKKSTEAQIRASVKYNSHRDNIMIRPTTEEGEKIRAAARSAGLPVQRYILQAVWEHMEREQADRGVSGISVQPPTEK